MRLLRAFLSVKIEGLDRYSAGVPLAVLYSFWLLTVFSLFSLVPSGRY